MNYVDCVIKEDFAEGIIDFVDVFGLDVTMDIIDYCGGGYVVFSNTKLNPESFRCSQAMALRLGLSHSLQNVSEILNLDVKKDKEGKVLIKYFNSHSPSDDLLKWES